MLNPQSEVFTEIMANRKTQETFSWISKKAHLVTRSIISRFTWQQWCQHIYQFHALMSTFHLNWTTLQQQPGHSIFQQNAFKLWWLPSPAVFLLEQYMLSHSF